MITVSNKNYEILGNNTYRDTSTNEIVDGNSLPNNRHINLGSGNNLAGASIGNMTTTICDLFSKLSELKSESLKIISSIGEVRFEKGWEEISNFWEKDLTVDANGIFKRKSPHQPRYQIVAKAKKKFTFSERGARGFLGVLSVMSIIGAVFFLRPTIDLFTQEKKHVLFALRV